MDRFLVGYPTLTLANPKGYLTALVMVVAAFPEWAAAPAFKACKAANPKFPPSDGELQNHFEAEVEPYRRIEDRRAREAKNREISAAEQADRPKITGESPARGQVYDARNFHEAVAKHGRPIGVFETEGRTVPYRGGSR